MDMSSEDNKIKKKDLISKPRQSRYRYCGLGPKYKRLFSAYSTRSGWEESVRVRQKKRLKV
jgi:hypothetical protein